MVDPNLLVLFDNVVDTDMLDKAMVETVSNEFVGEGSIECPSWPGGIGMCCVLAKMKFTMRVFLMTTGFDGS